MAGLNLHPICEKQIARMEKMEKKLGVIEKVILIIALKHAGELVPLVAAGVVTLVHNVSG